MSIEGAAGAHALRGLRLLLEAYCGAELPQWEFFAANVRAMRVDTGNVLFAAGQQHPFVYFVQRGLFKGQAAWGDDRANIVFFCEEGDLVAPMSALGMDSLRQVAQRGLHPRSDVLRTAVTAETMHTVIALESSLVLQVNYRVLDHLASQYLQWARLVTAVSLINTTTLQADVVWLRRTAEARYRDLVREHPDLVARVTQRDLASYLNITDVALSRMIKRIRTEELTADGAAAPEN